MPWMKQSHTAHLLSLTFDASLKRRYRLESSTLARLLVWTPLGPRQEYRLTDTVHIGRSSDRDIQVDDAKLSRKHAVISALDGHFWLQDLSSLNGTWLNGCRVYGPVRLVDGDQIELGSSRAIFSDRLQLGIAMYDRPITGPQAQIANRLSAHEHGPVSDTPSVLCPAQNS